MIKKISIIIVLILWELNTYSQKIVEPGLVKWYTIEQADSLQKNLPKPWIIDVYTEWCGWCVRMMQTTFANPGIANYINTNFYPVRFDAETHDTVLFREKTYINPNPQKKSTHQLAQFLLNGRMSYPTIVYTDRKGQLMPVPGYMTSKQIEPLLIYLNEEANTNVAFPDFERYFQAAFPEVYSDDLKQIPDSLRPKTDGSVKWLSIDEVTKKEKNTPKPIFITFYTDWCNTCRVYEKAVLKNPEIAEILNVKYYSVRFNAASQDTVDFLGKKFYGNGIGQPHQLTIEILKGNYKMPSDVYMNDKGKILNGVSGFLLPTQLESILNYLSSDLKMTYPDFMKTFKGKIKN